VQRVPVPAPRFDDHLSKQIAGIGTSALRVVRSTSPASITRLLALSPAPFLGSAAHVPAVPT
jgi:hypothetical protein